jgi:rhodanese-related sulfurtransferase
MVRGMRTLLLAVALSVGAGACDRADRHPGKDEAATAVPLVSVAEVDRQLAAGACVVVDANREPTRRRLGTLPRAVLLTDAQDFALSELPADKRQPLVFYCANTRCTASHEAARKALAAGYTKVAVMPDGIAGWIEAGKRVEAL